MIKGNLKFIVVYNTLTRFTLIVRSYGFIYNIMINLSFDKIYYNCRYVSIMEYII